MDLYYNQLRNYKPHNVGIQKNLYNALLSVIIYQVLFQTQSIVDFRINETLQPGAVRKTKLPFYRLVGAVSNCAYAVRLETAPTGPDKSGSKPRGESVHLFLESTKDN